MAKRKPKLKTAAADEKPPVGIRDRIKELRRVPAAELQKNPKNFRLHGDEQRAKMSALLNRIGFADALLARELPGGVLELLDGHLRQDLAPDTMVPVLVVDLDETEADLLLATLDEMASLADIDEEKLRALLKDAETGDAAIDGILADMAAAHDLELDDAAAEEAAGADAPLDESYSVVVECASEEEQRELFDALTSEGRNCRLLTM